MKLLFLIGCIGFICHPAHAQTQQKLTLEACYRLARQNYPLIRQKKLIEQAREYSIDNVSKGYLPQVSFIGQASYQSDVTELPIKIPNTVIPSISKDQYKVYSEISQILSDGSLIKTQKQSINANTTVEYQKVEVALYALKERLNQIFFGILLVNEQDSLTEILKKDIQNGVASARAAIANGTALKSSGDVLQAEMLTVNQQSIELKANRKAYLKMLGQFLNQSLAENMCLEKPPQILAEPLNILRPELLLFEDQKKMVDVQNKLLRARNQPRIGLFLQAGYGKPALNLLKNDFSGYYIGGIRASWPLSGFYTYKKDRALLENNRQSINIQQEIFLFNTTNTWQQQNEEINKFQDLILADAEIIQLRIRIKNTAMAQLEYGVINSSDYLREVNAEAEAKRNQSLHDIQLLKAQYDQQTTSGN